jgi:hypothetical protein
VMDPCCAPSNAFHAHFLPDRLAVSSLLIAIGGAADRALVRAVPYLLGARHPLRTAKERRSSTGSGAVGTGLVSPSDPGPSPTTAATESTAAR